MASRRRLAAPKSGCSQQVLLTTVLPSIWLYSHFINPYSDNIIIACCGELLSYLNTITPYSENIAT